MNCYFNGDGDFPVGENDDYSYQEFSNEESQKEAIADYQTEMQEMMMAGAL